MSDLLPIDENLPHFLNQQTYLEGELLSINQYITNSLLKFHSVVQSLDIEQLGKVKMMVASHMQDKTLESIFGVYMIEQIDHRIRLLMDKKQDK
jgi:hypothetical protein